MNNKSILISLAVVIVLTWTNPAAARDLAEAAQSAQTTLNRIGVAGIGIGFTVGGILFTLGMAQMGRNVLVSAAIGAASILAAPAVLNFLGRTFGASL